jgi:predicted permease
MRAIPLITALELPRAAEIHMNGVVLGFAVALSMLTGTMFGLAPALGASRPDLIHMLRASGEAGTKGTPRRIFAVLNVRGLLSVGQIALSVILLIGATLLIESVTYLRNIDIGFNPAKLLTVSISLPPLRYDTDQKKASFLRELTQHIEALPGVRGTAVAMAVPMMGYAGIPVQDASKPLLKLNERLIAKFLPVSPGYFRTLQIPLKRGRDFTEQDRRTTRRLAIIDESLARRLWPTYPAGPDPIGQHLWVGGVNPKPAEIVGVVANVRQNLDSRNDWQESVYVSYAENPTPSVVLVVRAAGDPLALTGAVREQVRLLDRNQPIGAVETMDDLVEAQVGQRRLLLALLGSFALVALLLALIGIYGVIAYSVSQRVQEIGVRRALGAQHGDILRLVLGKGIVLTLAGIGIGITGALVLTRVMRTFLFHVSTTDPATFVGIAGLFLLIALAASYIPGHRATRIDPLAALRV